jgi:hypothetical protein
MALTRPRAYQIYDIDYKQATRVVTTTNIALAGGAPSTVDSISLAANDRVLVTGQTSGAQNGIYIVQTLGTGSNGTWIRSTDTNATGELLGGTIVMVTEGAVYQDTQWKLTTDDPITIGTTALTFVQNYSANSISAGTSNVTVVSNGNVNISSGGTPNVLVVSSTGTVTTGTASVTGNITGSYFFGNGSQLTGLPATYSNSNVAAFLAAFGSNTISTTGTITAGNITGGNVLTSGIVSATGNVSGNYFLGNGSQLTGISASASQIVNGNSNVSINSANANVSITVAGGDANSSVFSPGSLFTGLVAVPKTLTGNVIIASNSFGAIISGTVITGNLQIPDGSTVYTWTPA